MGASASNSKWLRRFPFRVMLDFGRVTGQQGWQLASVFRKASQLAELLERVKHGEEVTILEAGVAIARLVPAPKQRSPRILGKTRGLSSSPLTLTLSYQKTSSTIFWTLVHRKYARLLIPMLLFGGLRTILNCRMPRELVLPTLITMFSVLQAPGIITKVNIGKLILPEPSQSYIPINLKAYPFKWIMCCKSLLFQIITATHLIVFWLLRVKLRKCPFWPQTI